MLHACLCTKGLFYWLGILTNQVAGRVLVVYGDSAGRAVLTPDEPLAQTRAAEHVTILANHRLPNLQTTTAAAECECVDGGGEVPVTTTRA